MPFFRDVFSDKPVAGANEIGNISDWSGRAAAGAEDSRGAAGDLDSHCCLKLQSMIWKSLLSLSSLGHAYASTAASPVPTVTTDVVVIGGDSAGTYTVIRLRQLGKSVFVIEKEDVLGGHTNTFHVPGTNTTFDYGVIS
ncbi:hypothetical protein C8J57DRAFT_1531900 [Mycena rebaudengoi]|nr:hypothetical protein C8J57DRAFT_1531900 [Mycena rebaudengoi]